MDTGLLATDAKNLPFGMRIEVQNYGKNPATDALFDIYLFQNLGHHDEDKLGELRKILIDQIESGHRRPTIILPGEKQTRNRAEALAINENNVSETVGGEMPTACVVAIYRVPGETECNRPVVTAADQAALA